MKRKRRKRGYIKWETKLAAALCQLVRPTGDPARPFERIIPHDEAKGMSAKQIIRKFRPDHYPKRHADGGPDKHWNLTWLPKADHDAKTYTKDIPEVAKQDRLAPQQAEFRKRLLAKAGQGRAPPKKKPKSRPMPGSRASGVRKRMNGTVEPW